MKSLSEDITCKVTGSLNILIKGYGDGENLNEPLYAVNWFSAKMEWMYHVYNYLASRSVAKVGGGAFFKGKLTETIIDEANVHRELLLIVKYPGAQNFKALMELTIFKVVSILRILAVKQFTFGFSQKKIVDINSSKEDGLEYLIHHYKVVDRSIDYTQALKKVIPDSVNVKYAGQMVADLYSQSGKKEAEGVPNTMDGLIIYEAKSKDVLSSMIESLEYIDVINNLESSYVGFVDRLI